MIYLIHRKFGTIRENPDYTAGWVQPSEWVILDHFPTRDDYFQYIEGGCLPSISPPSGSMTSGSFNANRSGKSTSMLADYITSVKSGRRAMIHGPDYVVMDRKTFENIYSDKRYVADAFCGECWEQAKARYPVADFPYMECADDWYQLYRKNCQHKSKED